MIELTEALPFAKKANESLKGLEIINAEVLKFPHKFAWFNHENDLFKNKLMNRQIVEVTSSAHFIRFILDNQNELAISEDVSFTYANQLSNKTKHQLKLDLSNGYSLIFQIKLYGFVLLGTKDELSEQQHYYRKAIEAISPLDDRFTFEYFKERTMLDSKKGSLKQALATEQHIPGFGNGLLQDVLFHAKMSPKRKISLLTEEDNKNLYQKLIEKITEIVTKGGRDLQIDMFGERGGYTTLMTSARDTCPICHQPLSKEAYLGGKVIYCPFCQIE